MPITLIASGQREVLDEEKATGMIAGWRDLLLNHRRDNPSVSNLCDKIVLANKSYTSAAAEVIRSFLSSTDEFEPSIASGISIADVKDIIASRMEDEGLEVLETISRTFEESRLIEVDLSENAMGSKGVTKCMTILGGNHNVTATLERLSLCNNGLSEYTMNEVADLLTKEGECIAQNLTQIHFYNNMSGPNGCKAFERILQKCTKNKMTDIRFSSTRAGPEGSVHIVAALHSLATGNNLEHLVRLDLADNTFSRANSYKDLASALNYCPKLKYLNLKDCMLGDEGIKLVCNALNTTELTFLDVSGNEITASGAKYVAKLIKNLNGSLEDFLAEENEMTSVGIKRVTDAINSPTLKTIILNQNECGDSGGFAAIDMVTQNRIPNLEKIELNENMFQSHVVESLTQTFGEKLPDMEDNDEEEDVDELLSSGEEEEIDEEKVLGEEKDGAVDELSGALKHVSI